MRTFREPPLGEGAVAALELPAGRQEDHPVHVILEVEATTGAIEGFPAEFLPARRREELLRSAGERGGVFYDSQVPVRVRARGL